MDRDLENENLEESAGSNTVHFVCPKILASLSHLDLSGQVALEQAKVVGTGAYGDVFKGTCTLQDRGNTKVAFKRLRFYMNKDIKLLFEKEIYVWSKLSHANVLPLLGYAFDIASGYPLLVSKWMEEGSAWTYVHNNPHCDLIRLVTGIAQGLAYLHNEGVVHSDIKSDNIVISSSGDPLICDFGCARMTAASRSLANISSRPKGTIRYLAYELVVPESDSAGYSTKADVWAFGMTVFELLAHQRPYGHLRDTQVSMAIAGHMLPSLPSSCDSEAKDILWNICRRCWIFDITYRADMATILADLRDTIEQEGKSEKNPELDSCVDSESDTGAPTSEESRVAEDAISRAPEQLVSPTRADSDFYDDEDYTHDGHNEEYTGKGQDIENRFIVDYHFIDALAIDALATIAAAAAGTAAATTATATMAKATMEVATMAKTTMETATMEMATMATTTMTLLSGLFLCTSSPPVMAKTPIDETPCLD